MFEISELSAEYYHLKAKMQRARWLYVLRIKKTIEVDPSALERAARVMMFRGLFKTPITSDVEYAILRRMYFMDIGKAYRNGKDGDAFGWHHWKAEKGWKRNGGKHWCRKSS